MQTELSFKNDIAAGASDTKLRFRRSQLSDNLIIEYVVDGDVFDSLEVEGETFLRGINLTLA